MAQTTVDPQPPLHASWHESRVRIEATRQRQTEPPSSPFRDVLAGTASVLMSGAQIATHVLGVPALAAAVADARVGVGAAIGTAGVGGGPPAALVPAGAAAPETALVTAAGTAVAGGGQGSELATMQAMQRESQVFNLQLLELQEQVQQENRRFTTLSNVLRAKHDTAKAAVSNIRS